MTVRSSGPGRAGTAFMVGAGDGPANSGVRRRYERSTGSVDGTGQAPVAVSGPRGPLLAALVDLLAHGGRPRRRRPLDGVHLARRIRGHLVARLLARSPGDRKSTRLNSSHVAISYAVFCLKKKKKKIIHILMLKNNFNE